MMISRNTNSCWMTFFMNGNHSLTHIEQNKDIKLRKKVINKKKNDKS